MAKHEGTIAVPSLHSSMAFPKQKSIGYCIPFTGLGDTIYMRPHILKLATKYSTLRVRTPWPELFSDAKNIEFIHPHMDYRTQMKNVSRLGSSVRWVPSNLLTSTVDAQATKFSYDLKTLQRHGSIPAALNFMCHVSDTSIDLSLPFYPTVRQSLMMKLEAFGWQRQNLCIVRPTTIRKEWTNTARATKQSYIKEAADIARQRNFFTVQIADCNGVDEWVESPQVWSDATFTSGELTPAEIIELARIAKCMITGVGFTFCVALACKVPTLVIYGGQGGINRPSILIGGKYDDSNMTHLLPDQHCQCTSMQHSCNKTISNFTDKTQNFFNALS